MAAKYVMDAMVIYALSGVIWTPVDYLIPLVTLVGPKGGPVMVQREHARHLMSGNPGRLSSVGGTVPAGGGLIV
jgi:hypothetical protein